ncbi:MAG: TRAP transporter substrate-binding protein DctP [Trueperaceae bacterium]|nr:TRAP transporter substrate-binding protein DctP [Trueperaceae bacterium]
MKRRDFLKKAGVATASASLSPLMFANAQSATYRLDMVTSWPRGLPALFGGAENVARYLNELTDGDVEVTVHPAGAQVAAFEVYDAVSSGAFAMGHAAPYYFINKNPTHAFFTAVPFGMDGQQFNAWMHAGGGQDLADELTAPDDVIMYPAGNTGAQTSGWFNTEINTIEDFQGLTIRFPGFGGQVLSRVGANVQNLPGGEVFQALDSGVIDAADWVGPYDDQTFGMQNAARYYYFPSWAEPGAALAVYMNRSQYEDLPADIQAAFRTAAARANQQMLAEYDALNGPALQELIDGGTEIRFLSNEVLAALEAATEEIHAENANGNELYGRVLENYDAFKERVRFWHAVGQHRYASYVHRDD